ncbi:MAG: hypothetical protein IT584_02470 [Chlamydiae bacterium]|nr:hypothetical protein [Chlamydiota bacterium]
MFLNKTPDERKQRLFRFLSEEEKSRLSQLSDFQIPLEPSSWKPEFLVDSVHWSWLIAPLKAYLPHEQKLFLASLDPLLAEPLVKSLQLFGPLPSITETAKNYFRSVLEKSLLTETEALLPIHFFSENPLSELLKCSKKQLMHLVDLLALQDLAAELRHIVETKTLKKIYSFLTKEEQKRLKEISSQKDPFLPNRLSLERWDGTEESLRLLLHKRGLSRLGLALADQDPQFVWYLCHQFDIGRAAIIKLALKQAPDRRSESICREIKELTRDYL